MILADKLAQLRRKNGWSQEELAEKMQVSRQAVSKWESAQSVPDLEKLLRLSDLFGVTTDYLLKDELEEAEYTNEAETHFSVRRVSMEEANTYLALRQSAAKRIALATFLCILAPVCLLLLAVTCETWYPAIILGLIILFLLVAVAVVIFLSCGAKNAPYEFLEKEPFETEYGVTGMVRERRKAFQDTYTRYNLIAACICILSPIPLLVGSLRQPESGLLIMVSLALTMLIAGCGAAIFIVAGVQWASLQKLLQEGDFTPKKKQRSTFRDAVSCAYWLLATGIYLAWSFTTGGWNTTWIVWPVAGVLFGAVMAVTGIHTGRRS